MRNVRLGVLLAALGCAPVALAAGDHGTRAEARALLDRVVADLGKDEAGTLARITQRAYNDRDLYPFCSGPDGKVSAHGANPQRIGTDQASLKDATGKPFGAELRRVAKPGSVAEVSYVYARPDGTGQAPKVSLVTKVGGQVCAVGYYAEPQTGK